MSEVSEIELIKKKKVRCPKSKECMFSREYKSSSPQNFTINLSSGINLKLLNKKLKRSFDRNPIENKIKRAVPIKPLLFTNSTFP